jgi:ribosomal-protein-alanine N-acetyltransferase
MAVLQKIREFFVPVPVELDQVPAPAPAATAYEICPLTDKQLTEVLLLNQRCFKKGENYSKYTFSFLLSEPNTLSYRLITPTKEMVAFVFITVTPEGTGHITTIGVSPEHRRRGLAQRLLAFVEDALRKRKIHTVFLEVRTDNLPAQALYRRFDYAIVQRLPKYYNNGEDGFLMVKSLLP